MQGSVKNKKSTTEQNHPIAVAQQILFWKSMLSADNPINFCICHANLELHECIHGSNPKKVFGGKTLKSFQRFFRTWLT